jgi:hypothetical protein
MKVVAALELVYIGEKSKVDAILDTLKDTVEDGVDISYAMLNYEEITEEER